MHGSENVGFGQAWDTLFWFAVLVGLSGQLNSQGVIKHFADAVGGKLVALNMGAHRPPMMDNVAPCPESSHLHLPYPLPDGCVSASISTAQEHMQS